MNATIRTADARHGLCRLSIDEELGRYVFEGPSGPHGLDIGATDDARLDAHWTGYVENNGGELTTDEHAAIEHDRALVEDVQTVSWWAYRDNGTPGPETNQHLQLEDADRTLCGRRFPDDAVWESGDGQTPCRGCERVQEAAERRRG